MQDTGWQRTLVLGSALCVGTLLPAGAASAGPVKTVANVAYYAGEDADPVRHRLDLYLPADQKDFPVLVLVHGGAWIMGDRSFFGWGPELGHYFAGRGIGVVMPSYRLSPAVRHPEHARDVARAVAWTARHIAEYDGDRGRLYLGGHSAGGHLACLVAADPTYLEAEGLPRSLIKGVISVSGVYRVPAIDLSFGLAPLAGLIRTAIEKGTALPKGRADSRHPIPLNLFRVVFTTDVKACAGASPLTYVRPGLPPFLLINAEYELPLLPQMTRDFARALRAAGGEVQTLEVEDRDHETVMFFASSPADPTARAIERFIRAPLGKPRSAP